MKPGNKIIHVEFNNENLHPTPDNQEGKHFAFGSLAAIYTVFSNKDIGTGVRGLYGLTPEEPIITKNCTVRESVIVRKETNRKSPVKIIRVID